MSVRLAVLALLTAAVLTPSLASADRPRAERVGDQIERADNAAETRDDMRDARQLDRWIEVWLDARASDNVPQERQADRNLERWMRQELAETRGEVAEANAEVRRSTVERNQSRRERNRTTGTGRPGQAADDRRDLRDDRRDLRDDRRDATQERNELAQKRDIARELEAMQPAFDSQTATPQQYARKRVLLLELQVMARAEIARDHQEQREDTRELREDRRETREDRRHR